MGHVWDWRDPDGDRIWVRKGLAAAGIAAIGSYDPSDDARVNVTIPHGQAAEVADGLCAAIREAAGLPAPIILERPELAGTSTVFPGIRIWPEDGALMAAGDARLSPAMARSLAAYIVARADELEQAAAGPDPADVEALTAILDPWRSAVPEVRTPEETARAILRAGWRPPERDGGQR